MRPRTLELEGFTAYREPVTLDFTGADYFALVGPTGAGKSSIIDAMTFALYGRIPRLDARSVEPVIAKGKQEARIRFDFSIGETVYTVARVVRRLGTGASTKEARLERGEESLAGDAETVTAEVERLLGLRFEEFTRCVVLPQGDFARFMHDKPADRGNLLTRLLDLGIYERVGQRANTRATVAETELTLSRRRLEEDLSFATPQALADATTRVERLTALRAAIETDEPRLEELRGTVRDARAEAAAGTQAAATLASIRAPEDLATLGAAAGEARAAVEAASAALEAAGTAAASADETLAALGERAPVAAAIQAHAERAAAAEALAATEAAIAQTEAALQAATAEAAAAEARAREAEAALESAKIAHRAADLARALVAGEDCPVCGREVHEVPHVEVPLDLTVAEGALREARATLKEAEAARADHDRRLAAARARATGQREAVASLAERIAGFEDLAAARARLTQIEAAEAEAKRARAAEQEARRAAAAAREALAKAEGSLTEAWNTIQSARDAVASLSPPPLSMQDLIADWQALTGWAAERARASQRAAAEADARAAAAEQEGTAIRARQVQACLDAGIAEVTDPRDDAVKELARASEARNNVEEALAKAEEVRAEVEALTERTAVAKALGQHLRASGFERWVLRQALTTLAEGATRILLELSGGAYSLDLDKSYNFAVVDHRNADARRSARTLSGGETFLASLALALAMSDRIAQLSAHSAVRLESIFLDEGFGALDPETLDVVRSAIEGLAARNRTVGIVTHVRALAEEIPVRFEVKKGPTTSTVERVLA